MNRLEGVNRMGGREPRGGSASLAVGNPVAIVEHSVVGNPMAVPQYSAVGTPRWS